MRYEVRFETDFQCFVRRYNDETRPGNTWDKHVTLPGAGEEMKKTEQTARFDRAITDDIAIH